MTSVLCKNAFQLAMNAAESVFYVLQTKCAHVLIKCSQHSFLLLHDTDVSGASLQLLPPVTLWIQLVDQRCEEPPGNWTTEQKKSDEEQQKRKQKIRLTWKRWRRTEPGPWCCCVERKQSVGKEGKKGEKNPYEDGRILKCLLGG